MQHTASPVIATIPNQRWIRLIPIAMIIYIISFMDRTNFGYALAGLGTDLGLDKATLGLITGIFFVGYVFLQIPGGILASRWSAKRFIGIMILVWGLFACLEGLVHTVGQLIAVRFLLGVAEGGVWPAMLVLLTRWFPVDERARAYGFWMINLAVSSIITQPLSGAIVQSTGWRGLFIIEGLLPFVIAAPLWWRFVADRPSEAAWLSPVERDYIESSLAEDARREPPPMTIAQALANRRVWGLVLVYFLIQVGFYGLNTWIPTLFKSLTGLGFGAVGVIAMVPYLVAIVGLSVNGIWADRTKRYAWHVFGAMVVAALGLMISVSAGPSAIALSIAAVSLAMGGALAYDGPFWAATSRAIPSAVAGGAMGLVNALGNLGGFLGPYLGGYLQQTSGSFNSTAIAYAISLILAGIVMLLVVPRPQRIAARPVAA
ncbi:MAG TPA: MFS transporter [Candidatus Limnocylindria bacterium]|jgi:sugar phosphate permease|nr:MFS transporter [Candidatus Limnocylindria bacterium]